MKENFDRSEFLVIRSEGFSVKKGCFILFFCFLVIATVYKACLGISMHPHTLCKHIYTSLGSIRTLNNTSLFSFLPYSLSDAKDFAV